jgi:hypothetical protein
LRPRVSFLKKNKTEQTPLSFAFPERIPQEAIKSGDRARRGLGSTSFRAIGKGSYTITKNNEKVVVNSQVEKESGGGFSILLSTDKQTTPIGRFMISKSTAPPGWNMIWRRIQPDYRGYNLGRLGFRLAEQEVRRQGGRKMVFYTGRVDALKTALAMGYVPATEQSEKTIKHLIGIPKKTALPKGPAIAKKLNTQSTQTFQGIFLVRELQ